MSLKIINNFVWIIILVVSACSYENESSLFRENERSWKSCYDDHFYFTNDHSILQGEYIKCELDQKRVLINAGVSGYQGVTYFKSGSIVVDSSIVLPGNGNYKNQVLIAFFEPTFLTGFYIQLDYPKDSLNQTIQSTFSEDYINCASIFIDNGIQFCIGTTCIPNGTIRFSTFYSLIENQRIKVDSFSFNRVHGVWYYKLAYSAENLVVTNERWNSQAKHDEFGKPVESNLFVVDLQVNDLQGYIEFELQSE